MRRQCSAERVASSDFIFCRGRNTVSASLPEDSMAPNAARPFSIYTSFSLISQKGLLSMIFRYTENMVDARRAASGMPMVQFSLVAMLGLVDRGVLSMERMVQLMCHNPARLFEVKDRGFLRKGYKADVTIVRRRPWVLTQSDIQSKCGWSPLVGQRFDWQVVRTICNGHTARCSLRRL